MKQGETIEKGYKKYVVVMLLCFLFGGFSLIMYIMLFYSILWQNEMILGIRREGEILNIPVFSNELGNASNETLPPPSPERRFIISNPSSLLLSPFLMAFLAAG